MPGPAERGRSWAVVFDLDGVLVESEGAWDSARRQLVAETVIAAPNREFPPSGDAIALADLAIGSLEELTPATIRLLQRGAA